MSEWFNIRQACPVCKSSHRTTLLKSAYAEPPIKDHLDSWYLYNFDCIKENYYTLDECNSCGLVYQREILNEQGMAKLYNEWVNYEKVFESNINKYTGDQGMAKAQELVNVFMYFDITPDKLNILDFGMGFGTWCYLAKGFGCSNVYGTELSQTRVDYARGIKIAAWKDLPDYQFDFINTEQVFEHLSYPGETLIHLRKDLSPNGVIKISVPDGKDFKKKTNMRAWKALKEQKISANSEEVWGHGSKNSLNPVAPLEHINCFNHDVLVKMAGRFGLSQVDIPSKRVVVRTDKYGIKNILRPYYHLLVNSLPLKMRSRNKTNLFFKKQESDSTGF